MKWLASLSIFWIWLSGCATNKTSQQIVSRPIESNTDTFSQESIDRSRDEGDQSGADTNQINLRLIALNCLESNGEESLLPIRSVPKSMNESYWITIGNCYLRKGKMKLARLHYNQAIKLNPDHPEAINNLAVVEQILGNSKDALGRYKILIEKNGLYRVPRWNLARIFLGYGHFDKALDLLLGLEREGQEDIEILRAIAVAYQGKGFFNESRKYYEMSKILDSDDRENKLNYAFLLWQTGKEQQAKDLAYSLQSQFNSREISDERKNIGLILKTIGEK